MSKGTLALVVASGMGAIVIIIIGYAYSFDAVGLPVWASAAVILVLSVISVGALATTKVIPRNARDPKEWLQWPVSGKAVYAIILALVSGTSMIDLFNPDSSKRDIEKVQQSVEATGAEVTAMAEGLERAGLTNSVKELMEASLLGVWGERGCDVTYELSLDGSALVMRSLKDPAGFEPFRQTIDLAPAVANGSGAFEVKGEIVTGPEQGSGITFQYERIGDFERLTRFQGVPVRSTSFERCAS
jgi:hypothetical protein